MATSLSYDCSSRTKNLPLPHPQDLEQAAEPDFGPAASFSHQKSCVFVAHLVVFAVDITFQCCSSLSVTISYHSKEPLRVQKSTVGDLEAILHLNIIGNSLLIVC